MTVTSPGGNFASMSTSAERMRRLRERRTVALIPVDGPSPLPEDEQLAPAVEESLGALKLRPEDAARPSWPGLTPWRSTGRRIQPWQ